MAASMTTCFIIVITVWMFIVHSEESITINPGDDIQGAIDKLSKDYGGGRVVFNKGTYTITKSIVTASHITLIGAAGVSYKDILITIDENDLKFNEPLLTSNDKLNSTNIAVVGLSFRCNIQPSEQHYPPCCHTSPSNCSANPPCSSMRANFNGISMGGGGFYNGSVDTSQNYNKTIRNVQVSQCAMGITSSGWRLLTIENVETFGNGMIQTFFHNIYFRRNTEIYITGLKSHDSPTGNGINISQSAFITAWLNTFWNNYWRGFRIYGEDGFTIYNINVYNMTAYNNSDDGFMFFNIINGEIYNNVAYDNEKNEADGNCKNCTFKNNKW